MSGGPWMGCICDADAFRVTEGPLEVPFDQALDAEGERVARALCVACGREYHWTADEGWTEGLA